MAISADGVYSETLQSLIDAKLEELAKKKDLYERSKVSVLESLPSQPDEAEKVRILKEGIKTCLKLWTSSDGTLHGVGMNTDLKQLLQNLDYFLEQPRYDPSLLSDQLRKWAAQLDHYLDIQSKRYTYAVLYGKLVAEWLGFEKRLGHKSETSDTMMADSFEELESSTRLQSRQDWEKVAFEPLATDTEAIQSLLKEIFGEKDGKNARTRMLNRLRDHISRFEEKMSSPDKFDEPTLRWTIQGLLSGNRLSEEKRTVLKDFLNNKVVLLEIADVLNLRMSNFSDWVWGPTIPIFQRRGLSGRYTISMQEDLLQAIFLQFIGVKWSVCLKRALRTFITNSEAWRPLNQPIPAVDRNRRTHYIGEANSKLGLNAKRNTIWVKNYFMAQLLSSVHSSIAEVDGAEEAVIQGSSSKRAKPARQQLASKAARRSVPSNYRQLKRLWMKASADEGLKADPADDEDDYESDDEDDYESDNDEDLDNQTKDIRKRSLIGAKQDLLKILRTEILINKRLHGGLTGFRAQYNGWSSHLPHSTILAVAEYLGVSGLWLRFFRVFLQAPLGFVVDGDMEDARARQRGVPMSHPLSDVLGEMVLFCLDVSVNQATEGRKLWRIHDDLWFWSADHKVSIQAWTTITKFNAIMGFSFDANRSGSVRVFKDVQNEADTVTVLPQRYIRWGFLYLDSQTGQWEIDESLVDSHAEELREQLENKNGSVLSWVQAWNAYANTFFTTNFGKPARCFGRAHTEKALLALERVQKKLFADTNTDNVVEYITAMLEQRFGVSNVPQGYCFFPSVLGGLDLQNPFIKLLLVHKTMEGDDDPERVLDFYEECEKDSYQKRKQIFEQGLLARNRLNEKLIPEGNDKNEFMSFDEYIRYREVLGYNYESELREVYQNLLEECTEHQVDATSDISTAVGMMDKGGVIGQSSAINGNWANTSPYWKWITQLYGGEIVKAFGGLNIVDNGILPVGMVSLLRSERVEWKS